MSSKEDLKKYFLAVAFLAVIMIALPVMVRFAKNPSLAGTESYYHARMALELAEKWVSKDVAIVGERVYVPHPYHVLLAGGYSFLGARVFTLFPFIFALAGFGLFWRLLEFFNVEQERKLWTLLAYALSPPFIASGFLNTPHAFVLVLLLAGLLLLATRLWFAGAFLILLAAFSGIPAMVAAIVLLLFLLFTRKGNAKVHATLILLIVVLLATGYYSPAIAPNGGIAHYLSDIGGIYGFGIFAFLLAIVGALQTWKHKKLYYGAYGTGIAFFIASFLFPDVLVFANVLVSVLAGVALANLALRKWQLDFLRGAVLLVIFCGLLFSGVSQGVSLAKLPPSADFFDALSLPRGVVLSDEKYGFWIEAAGHRAMIDSLVDDPLRHDDVRRLLNATDLDLARSLFEKYNVTYVLITHEMENGLFWQRENQGLSFLTSNEGVFRKVQETQGARVWEVTWKKRKE